MTVLGMELDLDLELELELELDRMSRLHLDPDLLVWEEVCGAWVTGAPSVQVQARQWAIKDKDMVLKAWVGRPSP